MVSRDARDNDSKQQREKNTSKFLINFASALLKTPDTMKFALKLSLALPLLASASKIDDDQGIHLRGSLTAPVEETTTAHRELYTTNFFVDYNGAGDGVTYNLDSVTNGASWVSGATTAPITGVPAGYTEDMFKAHRSSYGLIYTVYGFAPNSMNKITFGFAETYTDNCGLGKRIFDQNVNGLVVAHGVDVFKAAGCNAAYFVSGNISADPQGKYVIHIDGTTEFPMMSTIAIAPALPQQYWTAILINTIYTNDGSVYEVVGTTNTFGSSAAIANLGQWSKGLFKEMRSGSDFTYIVKVLAPNSMNTVTLGFAETYTPNCMSGKRVFDITAVGAISVVVADHLDVFVAANGCNTAYTITKTIKADGQGIISLNFKAWVEQAMVSFIKIDTLPSAPSAPTAPAPAPAPSTVVLQSTFSTASHGFAYVDDTIMQTNKPKYASGIFLPKGGLNGDGALQVTLGGIDDQIINGMSGAWKKSFSLTRAAVVTIKLAFQLEQATGYEAEEFSQVLCSIDGVLLGASGNPPYVAQLVGDGNNGPNKKYPETGYATVTLSAGKLSKGSHTLLVGGYNNQKTLRDESTWINIDSIEVSYV